MAKLDCGHDRPTLPAGHVGGTGVAEDRDGRTMCYPCSDRHEVDRVADPDTKIFVAYVSSDARSITTWPGGELARVTACRRLYRTWGGLSDGVYQVRARTPDGREWWGRNSGAGMVVTLRAAKR